MKLKGFTIIELLVSLVIVSVVVIIALGAVKGVSDDDVDFTFIDPRVETARSQRRMADEMTRQNDLMERRLQLLESQKQKAENE